MAERVTVSLIPSVVAQLADLATRTGMSKTDIINRAVTLYEVIDAQTREGARITSTSEAGEVRRLVIL